MADFWFHSLATGEKVVASSVQAISRLAQREADRFGQAVQVHTGEGRKSHRKVSMARNPAGRKNPASKKSKTNALMVYIEGRKAGKYGPARVACPYTGQDAVNWKKGFAKGKTERA